MENATSHYDLTVIVPVYNEVDNMPRLESELSNFLRQAAVPSCVLFVDDGSRYMKQASMNERKENMARLEKLIRNFDYPSERITYLTGGEFEKNFEIVRDYIQSLK